MPEARHVLLHEMTRSAFEEYLKSTPEPVALIPVGSIEQHGPHLPLGTDSLVALELCKAVARRANCVVVQAFLPGYSPHHMEFKGTISFHEETLVAVLYDTVECLVHHGVRKIMLINAHGGNREIIGYTAQMAERRYGATIIVPGRHELVAGSVEAVRESMRKMDVHSGKNETGMALALFPELVEMARVRGFTPTSKWYEGVRHLADPEHPDILLAAQIAGAYRGDTHQFTTSGIYGFTDPNEADAEESRRQFDATVETYARLIELWRTVPERA